MNLFLSSDFRSERIVESELLLETCVAIARVSAGPQSSGSDLRVDLLHHLPEVGRGQRLQAVLVAVFAEMIKCGRQSSLREDLEPSGPKWNGLFC